MPPDTPRAYGSFALHVAGQRAEYALSIVRAVFCLLSTVRFLWIHAAFELPDLLARAVSALPVSIFAFAFSLWMLVRIKRQRVNQRLLMVSTLLDASLCTLALSSNVVWPWPGYRGVVWMPEAMTFVPLVLAAGFRGSVRIAVMGGVANAFGFALLVLIDLSLNPTLAQYGPNEISMAALLLGCTIALSVGIAKRTQELVLDAATYMYKTTLAKRGLSALLEEHHDAVALVNAALFAAQELDTGRPAQNVVAQLSSDLELLRRSVVSIREQALGEVAALDEVSAVDLVEEVTTHRATFERSVTPMGVLWETTGVAAPVRLAGGARAFRRALLNLLVNAKEGNGQTGASRAIVRMSFDGGKLYVVVQDDGPGLTSDQGAKHQGSGVGLGFVRSVALASGGAFNLLDTQCGARATITLPTVQLSAEFNRQGWHAPDSAPVPSA